MKRSFRPAAAAAAAAALLLAAAAACVPGGCRRGAPPREITWTGMGTFVTLKLPAAETLPGDVLRSTVAREVRELEARLSIFSPTSELSRVNAQAGGEAVPVSASTAEILAMSRRYAALTGGAFDPTVLPLVRCWGFHGSDAPAAPPEPSRLAGVRTLVGYGRLAVSGPSARLERPGMQVDLGGIAKGYAVDVCCEKLLALGARHVMVNVGGNLKVLGRADGRRPWRVGVRNPLATSELIGTLTLTNGHAVATSGNYERFVTIGGRRYAHVLDPRTGKPVEGMAGVTVVARSAAEADAMSTALFVTGTNGAATILAGLPGCEALWVPDRRPLELVVTPGFRALFTPRRDIASRLSTLPPAPTPETRKAIKGLEAPPESL